MRCVNDPDVPRVHVEGQDTVVPSAFNDEDLTLIATCSNPDFFHIFLNPSIV